MKHLIRDRVKRIHVNKHVVAANRKHGQNEPPLTVKTSYDKAHANTKGHNVVIHDREGREVARVVHRPEKPLKCGAVIWIETKEGVIVS